MLDDKDQMHDLNIMKFARFERAELAASSSSPLNAPPEAGDEGACDAHNNARLAAPLAWNPLLTPCLCRVSDPELLYNAPAGHREILGNYHRYVAAKRAALHNEGSLHARLSFADPVACFEILPVRGAVLHACFSAPCRRSPNPAHATRLDSFARRLRTGRRRWARTSSGRASSA